MCKIIKNIGFEKSSRYNSYSLNLVVLPYDYQFGDRCLRQLWERAERRLKRE